MTPSKQTIRPIVTLTYVALHVVGKEKEQDMGILVRNGARDNLLLFQTTYLSDTLFRDGICVMTYTFRGLTTPIEHIKVHFSLRVYPSLLTYVVKSIKSGAIT